jgi:hypothetical protein
VSERRRRPVRRLRCETCLEVLSLRHAWDTAACRCGDLGLSGRPTKPVVHWLGRPGGGWTELDDEITPDEPPAVEPGAAESGEEPVRRLGFPRSTPRRGEDVGAEGGQAGGGSLAQMR